MKISLQATGLRRRITVIVLPLLHVVAAFAGTSVWTGGGPEPRFFSDSRNWLNGKVPASGDVLSLSGDSGTNNGVDDLPSRTFPSLQFTRGFITIFDDSETPELRVEAFIASQQSLSDSPHQGREVWIEPVVVAVGGAPKEVR